MSNILIFIICFVVVFAIGFSGSLSTKKVVKSKWYECIKSPLTPPKIVFPIVWNILYVLIAIALYFEIKAVQKQKDYLVIILFAVNLLSNGLWSYLFFNNKATFLAFLDLLVVLLTAVAIMIKAKDTRTKWLLLPYILWLAFAGLLNLGAWMKTKQCLKYF